MLTGRLCSQFHIFHFCPLCVLNVSPNCLPSRMKSHIGCICFNFLHCVFSNVFSNCLPKTMHKHIGCIYLTFSTLCFQMSLQITCLRGYEITLVAFVCVLPFVFVTGDFFWALFSLFQDFAQTPAYMISFTFSRSFQTEKNIKMKICIGLGNLT